MAYHAYGITGDALILIRPDGYIGLTGASTGPQPIIDYLRNVISRLRSPTSSNPKCHGSCGS